MDFSGFSSEFNDEQLPVLSMSLVSYASDADTSVDDATLNLKTGTIASPSDTDTLFGDECSASQEVEIDSFHQRAQQLSCTGLSAKTKTEVEKALSDAVDAKKAYLETMEVFRALQTVVMSDKLPKPTQENARRLLLKEELKQYAGTDEGVGILGLKDELLDADCPIVLSETDKKLIQSAVETQLIQNAMDLQRVQSSKHEIISKLSCNASSNSKTKVESDHTSRMSALRTELNAEMDKYYNHLSSLDSLLESIVQMKINQMNETSLKIIDGVEAKAQFLRQKARLINAQIQTAIYTEDAAVVTAVQRLEKDLDLFYSEIETDLTKTNALLAAYDRVMCPEYKRIFEEYQSIVKQIKSAKYILREGNN